MLLAVGKKDPSFEYSNVPRRKWLQKNRTPNVNSGYVGRQIDLDAGQPWDWKDEGVRLEGKFLKLGKQKRRA